MLKSKMLAMFGGLAILASGLVPGLASAHERDAFRTQVAVQVQPRVDAARWVRAEHARLHAENPYMTPWQHARMHRWLREQGRQMKREEVRRQRAWRAEQKRDQRRWERERWADRDHDGRIDRFERR